MQQVLTGIITAHVSKLDPALPAILAAHVWVAGAQVGSERLMTIGQEHTLLPGNVANPAFDYIALGHIHKHQVLTENPPAVYAGSLERVDFGEEGDEKGFYIVDIEQDKQTGSRKVSFSFHEVAGRPFHTIGVDIDEGDSNPMVTILESIHPDVVKDAIVRLQISLPAELEEQLRDSEIRGALKEAYYFTIAKDIRREARLRLGKTTAGEIAPLEALKTYLQTNYPADRAKVLLEYGERLMQRDEVDK
jgi:exonuclease SbcD